MKKTESDEIRLEVLISAFGVKGLKSIASLEHPRVPGVHYLVSWQPDGASHADIPEELSSRLDFKIFTTCTTGLAVNRNNALDHATAPLLLISDDDLSYKASQLKGIIAYLDSYKQCDLATFRFDSTKVSKWYPEKPCRLDRPSKGYYVTSFEIALRRKVLEKTGVRFNEWFGVNQEFIAGEEDVFLHDLIKAGARGWYVPFTICRHDGDTTSEREGDTSAFIRVKGAVFRHTHPWTWRLRMYVHAYRARRTFPGGFGAYCHAWLTGVRDARRLGVFRQN